MNVFIFGETGRMGQEVRKIVDADSSLEYCGGYSRQGVQRVDGKRPDVVIDFSLPETFSDLLSFIKEQPCALVSGTTGLNHDQFSFLKQLGEKTPAFWSANMSFGVYLMCKLTEILARYDQFYKMKIEETHHIHKKDKPSGTALIVGEAAQKSTSADIAIEALREGEVFGIHKFIAESKNEKIEISHEAHNRSLFAQGAVDIAKWVQKQPSGYYGMDAFFQSFES